MSPLKFICQATGNEIDTGIDLDAQIFAALPRDITPFDAPIATNRTCLPVSKRGSANPTTSKPQQPKWRRRHKFHVKVPTAKAD
jgi:hypothetical protein